MNRIQCTGVSNWHVPGQPHWLCVHLCSHWLVSGLISSIVHVSSPGFATKLTCVLLHVVTPSLDLNSVSIELEGGTQALLLTQKVISMILECII